MPFLIRVNPRGLQFQLSSTPGDNKTKITLIGSGKQITVAENIDVISSCWYEWQMRRAFIQDAFHFLSADEREFFMTGTTPEEWKAMFKDE